MLESTVMKITKTYKTRDKKLYEEMKTITQ